MNHSLPSDALASIALPPGPAGVYWPGLACWLPLCLAAAVAWGSLTVLIQAHFSPVLLFPLAVGIVLGIICAAALRVCRLAHRPSAIAGACWRRACWFGPSITLAIEWHAALRISKKICHWHRRHFLIWI